MHLYCCTGEWGLPQKEKTIFLKPMVFAGWPVKQGLEKVVVLFWLWKSWENFSCEEDSMNESFLLVNGQRMIRSLSANYNSNTVLSFEHSYIIATCCWPVFFEGTTSIPLLLIIYQTQFSEHSWTLYQSTVCFLWKSWFLHLKVFTPFNTTRKALNTWNKGCVIHSHVNLQCMKDACKPFLFTFVWWNE